MTREENNLGEMLRNNSMKTLTAEQKAIDDFIALFTGRKDDGIKEKVENVLDKEVEEFHILPIYQIVFKRDVKPLIISEGIFNCLIKAEVEKFNTPKSNTFQKEEMVHLFDSNNPKDRLSIWLSDILYITKV